MEAIPTATGTLSWRQKHRILTEFLPKIRLPSSALPVWTSDCPTGRWATARWGIRISARDASFIRSYAHFKEHADGDFSRKSLSFSAVENCKKEQLSASSYRLLSDRVHSHKHPSLRAVEAPRTRASEGVCTLPYDGATCPHVGRD